MILLLGALIAASGVYFEAYTAANITKALAITGVGWLAHLLIFQRLLIILPRVLEQFEHLLGMMSLMLLLLFGMVLA
jgi:multicomponent Na+:H+ antiporter subunit D